MVLKLKHCNGRNNQNITHANMSGMLLVGMLILPLFVTLIQFAIGKAVGKPFNASISAGQALGQKTRW